MKDVGILSRDEAIKFGGAVGPFLRASGGVEYDIRKQSHMRYTRNWTSIYRYRMRATRMRGSW